MGSGCVAISACVGRFIHISLTVLLLTWPVAGWGDEAPTGGGLEPSTIIKDYSSDWITINKDYSSQRYVDLDDITPDNVRDLKEICEIQLNEPVMFNTGLLKVGRTLYVATANQTAAFDAATCDLR